MRDRAGNQRRKAAALWALALCLPLLLAAGCASARTLKIGGQSVPLDAVSLDIRDAGVTDIAPLAELSALKSLDMRGNEIALADYDALAAALPDCAMLWSVPIAGGRADSDSAALTLPGYTAADLPMLAYFPNLTSVDAAGCADYAALRQAAAAYPGCAFHWTVGVGGLSVAWDTETLDLSGRQITEPELRAAIAGLPRLKEADLRDTGLDSSMLGELCAAWPEVLFRADVRLLDSLYSADTTELNLSGTANPDREALLAGLGHFTELKSVNLRGCALTNEDKAALLEAYPSLIFLWEAELLPGMIVDSELTEIIVTGYESPDVDTLIQNIAYLPQLTKLDLCACYKPGNDTNQKMERLMAAYPDVKFVWVVHVGNWEMRTDITAFSMGNKKTYEGGRFLGGSTYGSATDERIKPLKYCTDLIALDIGHAKRVTDISCLASLTKVRYLILGMTSIDNIDALSGMTELEFLELYQNWTSDLSPLLNCKKLKYLNIGTTFVETIDDIVQMTQLKRLWIMKPQVLTKADIAAIKQALPNTIIRSYMWAGGHSTTGGWRTKNPAYLHMQRDLFKLILQDQNVKEIGDEEYWGWDIEAFEAQ